MNSSARYILDNGINVLTGGAGRPGRARTTTTAAVAEPSPNAESSSEVKTTDPTSPGNAVKREDKALAIVQEGLEKAIARGVTTVAEIVKAAEVRVEKGVEAATAVEDKAVKGLKAAVQVKKELLPTPEKSIETILAEAAAAGAAEAQKQIDEELAAIAAAEKKKRNAATQAVAADIKAKAKEKVLEEFRQAKALADQAKREAEAASAAVAAAENLQKATENMSEVVKYLGKFVKNNNNTASNNISNVINKNSKGYFQNLDKIRSVITEQKTANVDLITKINSPKDIDSLIKTFETDLVKEISKISSAKKAVEKAVESDLAKLINEFLISNIKTIVLTFSIQTANSRKKDLIEKEKTEYLKRLGSTAVSGAIAPFKFIWNHPAAVVELAASAALLATAYAAQSSGIPFIPVSYAATSLAAVGVNIVIGTIRNKNPVLGKLVGVVAKTLSPLSRGIVEGLYSGSKDLVKSSMVKLYSASPSIKNEVVNASDKILAEGSKTDTSKVVSGNSSLSGCDGLCSANIVTVKGTVVSTRHCRQPANKYINENADVCVCVMHTNAPIDQLWRTKKSGGTRRLNRLNQRKTIKNKL